jgi:CRISPR-associated Csx2 family protein
MTDTVLLTFLGRVPRGQNGYRNTRYRFADGDTEPLAFFGWALQQRLRPRRLVILGTAGSMWDHLLEKDLDLGPIDEQLHLDLVAAVDNKQVTAEHLQAVEPLLSRHLGCTVELQLIPYCHDEAEQVELLRIIADHIHEHDHVHLDVTHGFRHLPMLVLLSALHLRLTRGAKVAGIWYGAYDPDSGKAPVHDLSGLLRIADGLQALASFQQDGNYRVFVPLLRNAGMAAATCEQLSQAAYFENILNAGEATGHLRKALTGLSSDQSTSAEGQLLLPVIRERLQWVAENRQFEKLTRLARQALERGDYLRATLYAFETVITRLCHRHGGDAGDFDRRERLRSDYEGRLRQRHDQEWDDYRLLKNLRNQVAHGSRGNLAEVQQVLLHEEQMRATLERLITAIEDRRLPSDGSPRG